MHMRKTIVFDLGCLAIGVFAIIFVLTEQSFGDMMVLSTSVSDAITSQSVDAGGINLRIIWYQN